VTLVNIINIEHDRNFVILPQPNNERFFQSGNPFMHNNAEINNYLVTKLNSVAVVRKQTIPTERPPLVGEVSSNLCG
jgi:hypothetical protein